MGGKDELEDQLDELIELDVAATHSTLINRYEEKKLKAKLDKPKAKARVSKKLAEMLETTLLAEVDPDEVTCDAALNDDLNGSESEQGGGGEPVLIVPVSSRGDLRYQRWCEAVVFGSDLLSERLVSLESKPIGYNDTVAIVATVSKVASLGETVFGCGLKALSNIIFASDRVFDETKTDRKSYGHTAVHIEGVKVAGARATQGPSGSEASANHRVDCIWFTPGRPLTGPMNGAPATFARFMWTADGPTGKCASLVEGDSTPFSVCLH